MARRKTLAVSRSLWDGVTLAEFAKLNITLTEAVERDRKWKAAVDLVLAEDVARKEMGADIRKITWGMFPPKEAPDAES